MHINSLKIQGFKSYRDETVVDPFSPGLNLLVGRNGSGKSNFFSAIRFVLSDAYTSLTREERQALLHDGSATAGGAAGGATMSAFVEIEFDNSDGRFPTNKPTLLLRRTIGLKKDEYQLDRKSTSKGEVMSLLESAGFSRSNPYYIVPQGRITHLTNQKDQDRLLLLKEVAGTKVYEERRSESMKIMEETEAKREKISDLLQYINDRLGELEEEKEELKQFQVQDRSRRSLEYAIYQRELKDVGELLEGVEEERRRDVDNANTKRTEFNNREKEMSDLDSTISEQRQRLQILMIEHRQTSAERREVDKRKAEVEYLVRDGKEMGKKSQVRLRKLGVELTAIEAKISTAESSLSSVVPEYDAALTAEASTSEQLEIAETTLGTLIAKQGRKNQFKSQSERDKHLRSAIAANAALVTARERQEAGTIKELEYSQAEMESVKEAGETLRNEIEERKEAMVALIEEAKAMSDESNKLVEKRKDLWKVDAKLDSQVRHAGEELKNAERTLGMTMDKATSSGLKAVKRIVEQLGLEGYHGPLYELFTVDDRYKTAVEVTAGNSLFHIVVDTDETATAILNVLNKDRAGRLTFMPLNRLKSQPVEYPSAKEAIAMIKKLEFDRMYNPAFEHVFGRTIICQSLEVAGAYTRSHGLNSITLDGDKYDRKGSLTGGYHDVRRSRLDAIKNLKHWQARYDADAAQLDEVKSTITRLDQEITRLIGKLQVVEGKKRKLIEEREPLVISAMSAQRELDELKTRMAKLESQLADHQSAIRNLKMEVGAYEGELKVKMEETLSSDELTQMQTLTQQVAAAKKTLIRQSKDRAEIATRKAILESELTDILLRRRDELRSKIDSFDESEAQQGDSAGVDVDASRREVARLAKAVEGQTAKLDEIDAAVEELKASIAKLEKERERKDTLQVEDSRNIERQQKNVERYLTKRQLLTQRKDEYNKNIRDLGVLPEEAFIETSASTTKLMRKLHKVNEALKSFAHVNKKAYEQYTSFTKQRDELITRRDELDASAVSIEELIDVLDMRKDEAIERTFKQVSKYFEEVFEKLVPAGRGRLIMQKREEEKEEDMEVDELDEDAPKKGGIESYTGVAIRVSFNSKHNEGLKIQQLSGGQKALVALAMIFAIQKCDPAPFYLFDEIDANLDADRRTGVAAMINELSQTGQYICTTFRPELIQHASACFGVFFDARKISTVKKITPEECMSFVDASERVREEK